MPTDWRERKKNCLSKIKLISIAEKKNEQTKEIVAPWSPHAFTMKNKHKNDNGNERHTFLRTVDVDLLCDMNKSWTPPKKTGIIDNEAIGTRFKAFEYPPPKSKGRIVFEATVLIAIANNPNARDSFRTNTILDLVLSKSSWVSFELTTGNSATKRTCQGCKIVWTIDHWPASFALRNLYKKRNSSRK